MHWLTSDHGWTISFHCQNISVLWLVMLLFPSVICLYNIIPGYRCFLQLLVWAILYLDMAVSCIFFPDQYYTRILLFPADICLSSLVGQGVTNPAVLLRTLTIFRICIGSLLVTVEQYHFLVKISACYDWWYLYFMQIFVWAILYQDISVSFSYFSEQYYTRILLFPVVICVSNIIPGYFCFL